MMATETNQTQTPTYPETGKHDITYCSELYIDNIKTKPLGFSSVSLYPYHDNNGKVEPILTQTKYITLQFNAINNKNKPYTSKFDNKSDKKTLVIKRALSTNDDTMDELFNFCNKLDKYMENNKEMILNDCADNKTKEYHKIVSTNIEHGYESIKLKLNIIKKDTQNKNLFDYVKIFYKPDSSNYNYQTQNKWKDYNVNDLYKVLTTGCKIRFILMINKIWYTKYEYGVNIKIAQIEIDKTVVNKFHILNRLKDNYSNMFVQDKNINKKSDDISDAMKRRTIYGMSKKKIESDNNKIVDILKNSDTKSLFDEQDYVETDQNPKNSFNLIVDI